APAAQTKPRGSPGACFAGKAVMTEIRPVDARPAPLRLTHAEGHGPTHWRGLGTVLAESPQCLCELIRSRTAFTHETSMAALFESRRHTDDADQRREYVRYLARQRGPMIHALMLVATLAYAVAAIASTFIRSSALPLPLRLAPLLPLLLVAMTARRASEPRHLSLLALLCVLLLEGGINLNSIGNVHGASGVMP